MRKRSIVSFLTVFAILLSLITPGFAQQNNENLPTSTVYMTEESQLEFVANLGQNSEIENVKWYMGDKELSEWKKWSMETGGFTGGDYITFEGNPVIENGQLRANLNFGLLFDTTDLSLRRPYNVRLEYPKHIGVYELKAVDTENNIQASISINLMPYESYMNYDAMVAKVDQIRRNAKTDRYVTVEQYGTSVQGRPLQMGIIAKTQEDVSNYLDVTVPMMVNNPQNMINMIESGDGDYKNVIFMNNIHPDEQPMVDVIVGLFEDFAIKDTIAYATTDENGNRVNISMNMDEILDNFIFIFSFTQNPDGLYANTRANANELDINRDNGYQTQPETKAMSGQISRYNPLMFLDFHGFVGGFLIEPCTPPHDPNYETDLLYDSLLENANRMGRAGVANSKYESYLIPLTDWGTGWDDATSAYTATYAMHHGALGHTIEVPEMNQESYKAGLYAGYAAVNYALEEKDMLAINQLRYFQRGLENIDDRAADEALVNPEGEIVGRLRGDNENFFPDYYVIPMGLDRQKNNNEAFRMIEYFTRNSVEVSQLLYDIGEFKAGDLVIDMKQAKRGYANHVLYSGMDESGWEEMYAEIVMNFPALRGFDIFEVREEGYFTGRLGEVSWEKAPSSTIEEGEYYLIHNNSVEAIKAVNQIIGQGMPVTIVNLGQGREGFAVASSAIESLGDDYQLRFEVLSGMPQGRALTEFKIEAIGSKALKIVLEEMGFILVEEGGDIIVTDSGSLDPELIGTKPMIAIGGSALSVIAESEKVEGLEIKTTDFYHEGLLHAVMNKSSLNTLGYKSNDYMYSNSGTWIEQIPAGFESLVNIRNSGDFYVSGWWPGNEELSGKSMAAKGRVDGQDLTLIAGNVFNKLHTRHLYRWISNSIYNTN